MAMFLVKKKTNRSELWPGNDIGLVIRVREKYDRKAKRLCPLVENRPRTPAVSCRSSFYKHNGKELLHNTLAGFVLEKRNYAVCFNFQPTVSLLGTEFLRCLSLQTRIFFLRFSDH